MATIILKTLNATMINPSNQNNIQFTWQAMGWRLLLTVLLLLLLAVSSVTIFHTVTTYPNTHVLPTAPTTLDAGR